MEIVLKEAKSILTPQRAGFLATGPYPFTHGLSSYVGCGFGQTTCGLYCYAQFLPSWSFNGSQADWGKAVHVKTNAAQLLDETLGAMKPAARQNLRILNQYLCEQAAGTGIIIGWSSAGFSGIPPRSAWVKQSAEIAVKEEPFPSLWTEVAKG